LPDKKQVAEQTVLFVHTLTLDILMWHQLELDWYFYLFFPWLIQISSPILPLFLESLIALDKLVTFPNWPVAKPLGHLP
jgi:hypothetical protein